METKKLVTEYLKKKDRLVKKGYDGKPVCYTVNYHFIHVKCFHSPEYLNNKSNPQIIDVIHYLNPGKATCFFCGEKIRKEVTQ